MEKQVLERRRRAEHNATERIRRGHLRSQYQQLAQALPAFHNNHRRPSKHQIVEKALDWVCQHQAYEPICLAEIRRLQKKQAKLLTQLKSLQQQEQQQNMVVPLDSPDDLTWYPHISITHPPAHAPATVPYYLAMQQQPQQPASWDNMYFVPMPLISNHQQA